MSYKDIIKDQLPPGLYEDNDGLHSKEIKVTGNALDDIQNEIDKLEIELLIPTAVNEGIQKFEEFLGIPMDSEKPIDQRKSVIIGRLRGNATVTKDLIKSVAESYDKGIVEVIEYFDQYSFVVKFVDTRGVPPNIEDLKAAIEEIKPAHLAVKYEYKYTIWGELKATIWGLIQNGSWDQLRTREFF